MAPLKPSSAAPICACPFSMPYLYPERLANPILPRLDWTQIQSLTFEPPDYDTFPCLRLAIDAGKKRRHLSRRTLCR